MGGPKQLLNYNGKPLLRHAAEVALEAACGPVLVVLGARAGEIRPAIEDLPVEIVLNPLWAGGMGTSIHAGIMAAQSKNLEGVILALADQPLVTAEILRRLVQVHGQSGRAIVASEYAGTAGVPAYFSSRFYPHLLALDPPQGCKGVILSHGGDAIRLECPEAVMDIDTPGDYQRLT